MLEYQKNPPSAISRAFALLTALCTALQPTLVFALPQGGVVADGQATIDSSLPNHLNINQSSHRAVLDWSSFNIDSGEGVNFNQPSSSAIALNRIHDQNPSQIHGNLTANGQVWLVNGNGVMFGQSAQVDVSGLVAGTADIDNDKFMNEATPRLNKPGNPNAKVINNGSITAKDGGLVALAGSHVENNGTIKANLGKVQLVSGSTYAVDMYGDGLINIEVSQDVQKQLVQNSGLIEANGGKVELTAAAGAQIVDSVINMDGIISAKTLNRKPGSVAIYAEGSNATKKTMLARKSGESKVQIAGKIDASGTNAGDKGGNVTITADNVSLLSGAKVDASGHSGGGIIEIGGGYQGKGDLANAQNTLIANGVELRADALHVGDGGRVIVWADHRTDFEGRISAKGGAFGGNGGFAETSGKETLRVTGRVDLSSASGSFGTWLLDPTDIIIYNRSGVGDGTNSFTAADLETMSVGANVSLLATNNITLDLTGDTITLASGRSFTLDAGNNILTASTGTVTTDNGAISFTGTNGIMLSHALNLNSGGGNITLNNATTATAALNVNAGTGTFTTGSTLAMGANNLSVTADDVALGGNLTGTGALLLQPYTASTIMRLNNGAGGFNLSSTELGYINNGTWSGVTYGNSSDTGNLYIGAFNPTQTTSFITGSGNIIWDLGGATMAGASGKSISATTSGGNITTASTGGITATKSAGNGGTIAMTAGGSGNIQFDHAFTLGTSGSGIVTLNAGQDFITNANTTLSTERVSNTVTAGRDITLNNAVITNQNTMNATRNLTYNSTITIPGGSGAGDGLALYGGGGSHTSTTGRIYNNGQIIMGRGGPTLVSGSYLGTRPDIDVNTSTIQWTGIDDNVGLGLTNRMGGLIIQGFNDITINRSVHANSITLLAYNNLTINQALRAGQSVINLTGNNGIYLNNDINYNSATCATGCYANFNSPTSISGNRTITTKNGVTFTGAVNGTTPGADSLTIDANAGTATFSSTVGATTALNNLSITADDVVFGGNITGTGALTLAPYTAATNINVNNGAGGFNLSSTELGRFVDGWSGITIGSSSITGALTVGSNTWLDPLTLLSGSGAMTISGAQTMGANNLTLQTDSDLSIGANLTGTGTLTIKPTTAGTTIGLGGGAGTLGLSASEIAYFVDGWNGITIGRADGTGAVQLGTTTFNNNTTVYGGDFSTTGNLTMVKDLSLISSGNIATSHTITKSSGTDATLSFKAAGNIGTNGAITSSSNKLNILYQSDTDADSSGYINIANAITTNHGWLTIGGGAGTISAGSGYAWGNAGQATGVLFGTSTLTLPGDISINSGAGNMIVNGHGYNNAAGSSNIGVGFANLTNKETSLTTTSGNVTINGIGGNGIATNYGVSLSGQLNRGGTGIRTTSGAINITAVGGSADTTSTYINNVGFYGYAAGLASTGTGAGLGAITVNGTAGNGYSGNVGISGSQQFRVDTVDANMVFDGTGNGVNNANHGVIVPQSGFNSTGTGSISITGHGGAGLSSNFGVDFSFSGGRAVVASGALTVLGYGGAGGSTAGYTNNFGVATEQFGNANIASTCNTGTCGDITITGYGANGFNNSYGVYFGTTGPTTVNANLIVNGYGGNASGSTNNVGVVSRNGINSTGTGNVTVNGTGGTGVSGNHGVYLLAGGNITAATGILNVTGTGGAGGTTSTYTGNYGILVTGANSKIASTGSGTPGTVTINGTGAAGYSNNYGVYVTSSGSLATVNAALNVSGTGGDGTQNGNNGIYLDGAITSTGTGAISLTATGKNSAVDFINTASASIGGASSSSNISIVADTATWSSLALNTSGIITLAPRTDSTTVGVAGGAGTFNISTTLLGNISRASEVRIGRTDGTGAFIANAYTWGRSAKFMSGSGLMTVAGAQAMGSNSLTLQTDSDLTISAALSGTGTLSILPSGTSASMSVNGTGSTLNVDNTEMGLISTGWSSQNYGSATGGALLSVANYNWADNVNFFNGSGEIRFTGGTSTLSANKYLTATSTSGDITSSANGGIVTSGTGYITLDSGNDLNFANDFDLTTGAGAILLKAKNSIIESGSGDIATGGGAITLNSDSDASLAGAITLGSGTNITSSGGNITLGGGSGAITGGTLNADGTVNTAASGFAYGTSAQAAGISITAVPLNSGGGNIIINGAGYTGGVNTANAHGVYITGSHTMQTGSGSGTFSVSGIGGGSGTGGTNRGVYDDSNVSGLRTVNGNLTVIGTGGIGAGSDGVNLTGAQVYTTGSGSLYVNGTGGGSSGIGIQFNGGQTSTGTGNIALYGTGAGNHGIYALGRTTGVHGVSGGSLMLTGSTNANVAGIKLGDNTTGYAFSSVGNTTISGTSTGTGAGASGVYMLNSRFSSVNGNITLTGIAASGTGATNTGLYMNTGGYSTYLQTTGSGNITVNSVSGSTGYGLYNAIANGLQTTGTGTITVNTDSMFLNAANNINSIGSLTIAAYTANRAVNIASATTGGLDISSTYLGYINGTNYTFGRTDGTGLMTVGAYNWAQDVLFQSGSGEIRFTGGTSTLSANKSLTATSTSGSITSSATGGIVTSGTGTITLDSGNDITFAHDFDLTTATGAVLLKAKNSILSSGSGDITTSGGAITLNSDSDASSAGAISLGSGTVLTSNGGNITLGGGATPASVAAYGTASNIYGIYLNNAQLLSSGGAINMTGTGYAAATDGNYGVYLYNGSIVQSTAGNIAITGTGGGTGASATNYGVALSTSNTTVTAAGGSIAITGTGGNTSGGNNHGVNVQQSTITTTGAGNLGITGTGRGTGSGGSNHGVYVGYSGTSNIRSTAAGGGSITINGTGGNGTGSGNKGVILDGGATINLTSVDGAISLTGQGGSSSGNSNYGIQISDVGTKTIQSTGSATISLTGTGGGTGASSGNYGILYRDTATLTSATGDITFNGVGGNVAGGSSSGVYLTGAGSIIQSTGAANISITGSNGYGISLFGGGIIRSTAANGGNITISGTGELQGISSHSGASVYTNGSGNVSITAVGTGGATGWLNQNVGSNVTIGGASQSGNITINADILSLTAFNTQTTGTVWYKPYSTGTTVGINGATGTLGITSTILAANSAGTLQIGRNDGTGLMRVAGLDLSARNYNLALLNGSGNIQLDGGTALTLAANKNFSATNTSGDITSSANGGIVTSGTGTITLESGNDLNFANDFDLTTATGAVLLKAKNSILSSGSGDITTSGGAITLNSDSDASSAGAISLGSGTALASGGGNITLGGGATPASVAAYGTASNTAGINLNAATLNSGTGNISMMGTGYTGGVNTGSAYGINMQGNAVAQTSGAGSTGTITMTGIGGGSGSGTSNIGVNFGTGTNRVTVINGNMNISGIGGNTTGGSNQGIRLLSSGSNTLETTGTGNIALNGTGGGTSGLYNIGVSTEGNGIVRSTASNGGSITLTGYSGTTGMTDSVYGSAGIVQQGAITSVDGNIVLNGNMNTTTGQTLSTSTADGLYGINLYSGTVSSTGNATITVNGLGAGSGSSGSDYGVFVSSGTITSAIGNIIVNGTGGSGTGHSQEGIYVKSGAIIESTGTATIAMNGTGGGGSTGRYATGIDVRGTVRSTGTNGGGITLTGYSGNMGGSGGETTYGSDGIFLVGSTITSKDGNIVLNGNMNTTTGQTLSTSTASGLYGIAIQGNSTVSSTGNAAIALNSAGLNGATDLFVTGANTIGGASAAGNINFNQNTTTWGSLTAQTTGTVTLAPRTTGTTIGINGAAGILGITSGILGSITAGTLQIGRNDGTGLMRVAGVDLSARNYGLSLLNGSGNIQLDGGGTALTLAANKNFSATTASGDIVSSANGGIVTSGTGTITLTSGNNITFANDFDLTSGTGTITETAAGAISYTGSGDITTGGNVVYTANAIDLASTTVQATGNVWVKAFTASTTTGVAGGAGTLNLTDAEIDNITAGSYTFGRTDGTGLMTVGAYNWPGSVLFQNGSGGIVYDFGGATSTLATGKSFTATTDSGNISNTGTGAITTNNGDITMTTNSGAITLNNFDLTAGGTGTITVAGFVQDVTITNSNIAAANADINITSGRDILSGGNYLLQTSGTGSINLTAGRDILMTHDLDLDAAGTGNITLLANNSIVYSGGGDITTHGGNIILNSDRDASGAGAISLGSGTILTSGGGNITLGGGSGAITGGTLNADGTLNTGATGYAWGTATQASGVSLTNATLNAGAGNIVVNGNGYNSAAANKYGVSISSASSLLQTTSGNISVSGIGGNGTSDNYGINLNNATNSAIVSSDGTISLIGTGGAGSSGGNHGIYTNASSSNPLITSGNGAIKVLGIGGAATSGANNWGMQIGSGYAIQSTGNSTITLNGTGGASASGGTNHGLYIAGKISTASSNIAMTGTGGNNNNTNNYGITVASTGIVETTGAGNINMTGYGALTASGTDNIGLNVGGIIRSTGVNGGNITVTGTGGGNSSAGHGIRVNGSGALVSTLDGTVTLNGFGSAAGVSNGWGFYMDNAATVQSTGAGNIVVNGTGGGAGNNNYGVSLAGSSSISSTGNAAITLTGIAGNGANNYGIFTGSGTNTIGGASDTGNITLIADKLSLTNYAAQTTGTVWYKPYTTSSTVGVAGSAGTLAITSSILAATSAGTLQIGRTDGTGLMRVAGLDLSARNYGLSLLNGSGNIQLDGGGTALTLAANKNFSATNTSGDITSSATGGIVTSGTGTITLESGNDLNFANDFDLTTGTGAVVEKAKNSIVYSGNGDITTSGGAITLNSDSDASGAGAISLAGSTLLTSNGGNITLGGGATPASVASYGTASNTAGINLNAATLNSGTGNISMRGAGYTGGVNTANAYGIVLQGGAVAQTSGAGSTGTITMAGLGGGSGSGANNHGIYFAGSSTSTVINGNMNLSGTGGATTGDLDVGVYIASGTAQTTGTGTLNLTGTGGGTGAAAYATGVRVDGTVRSTASNGGGINITGYYGNYNGSGSSGYGNGGVTLRGGTVTTQDGNIVINGNTGTTTGQVLTNSTGNGIMGVGLSLGGTISSTGNGTITVAGAAGGSGASTGNHGIYMTDTNTKITSATGNITLTGTGGAGSGGNNYGINLVSDADITSTGSANIQLTGIGGSGANNYGIGTTGATVAFGGGSDTGDITLNADTLSLGNQTFTTTGNVYIKPYTASTTVGINGAAGTLGITSGILGSITTGTLTIGRNDGTGLMRVAGVDLSARNYGLSLLNGSGNIQFDGGATALTLAANKNFSAVTTSGSFTTATNAGTITTSGTGDIAIDDPISLGANLTLNSADTITLGSTVNGAHDLTASAGTFSLDGNMGGTTPLGAVSLTSANALTLPSISASSIFARTTGANADLTIAAGKTLTASGAGNAITLVSSDDFINSSGAGALSLTGAGRWLIYSENPTQDTKGGLTGYTKRYNKTYAGYAPGSVTETGNVWLYSVAPTLTVTADNANKTYGSANPGFTASFSGFIDGDTVASLTGAAGLTTAANTNSGVGTYAINAALGTLANSLGYSFSYTDGTLAITPANLNVTALAATKNVGDSDPALTYGYSGLVAGDTNSVFTGALARAAGEAGGIYAINQGSLGAGTNYTILFTGANFVISGPTSPTNPPVQPPANIDIASLVSNISILPTYNTQESVAMTIGESGGTPGLKVQKNSICTSDRKNCVNIF